MPRGVVAAGAPGEAPPGPRAFFGLACRNLINTVCLSLYLDRSGEKCQNARRDFPRLAEATGHHLGHHLVATRRSSTVNPTGVQIWAHPSGLHPINSGVWGTPTPARGGGCGRWNTPWAPPNGPPLRRPAAPRPPRPRKRARPKQKVLRSGPSPNKGLCPSVRPPPAAVLGGSGGSGKQNYRDLRGPFRGCGKQNEAVSGARRRRALARRTGSGGREARPGGSTNTSA